MKLKTLLSTCISSLNLFGKALFSTNHKYIVYPFFTSLSRFNVIMKLKSLLSTCMHHGFNLFGKAWIFYPSQIYRFICIRGLILNQHYIIIGFSILLSFGGNTYMSFCEEYEVVRNYWPSDDYLHKYNQEYGFSDVNASRSCHEIMNEPLPHKVPMLVINADGSAIEYRLDGSVQTYLPAFLEIEVQEVFRPVVYEPFADDTSNDTDSDSDRDSNSDKESFVNNIGSAPDITHLSNPNDILKDYEDKMSIYFNKPDFIAQSITHVKKIMPNDLWAKSEQEVRNDAAAINVYLKEFVLNTSITNPQEAYSFVNFYASMVTHNTLNLYPELADNTGLIKNVYANSIDVTIKTYSLERIYPK